MKAKHTNQGLGFVPRTIEITIESQDELDALGSLFNFTPVTDTLNEKLGVSTRALDEALEAAGAQSSRYIRTFVEHMGNHPVLQNKKKKI